MSYGETDDLCGGRWVGVAFTFCASGLGDDRLVNVLSILLLI